MRVLLIAPDSKLPNLALMKLSAWHKAQGDEVGLNINNPDRIYGSILFTKNARLPASWRSMYPRAQVMVGGPGVDVTARLPAHVEAMKPDHTLYGGEYSIGRVTSGCPRKCFFCCVPQAEPQGIRRVQPVEDIWKPGTVLRLLDDNILAHPPAFSEVVEFCRANDVTVRFEYIDARLITPEVARALHSLKHHKGKIFISFDMWHDHDAIMTGIDNLVAAGFRPASIRVFVYMHNEAHIDNAMIRWDAARQRGTEPFLMVNNEKRTERMRRVARRGCSPAIYRHLTVEEVFE